jgi:agmatine/peptidylarginine deiminase
MAYAYPTRTNSPYALSSVYGKIGQILLSFPGEQEQVKAAMVIRRYKAMFEAFGDRVDFIIMGNFGDEAEKIKQELEDEGLRPTLINTPWNCRKSKGGTTSAHGEFIADPFVMMVSPTGDPILLEQYWDQECKNAFLAEQFADDMRVPILPTRYAIEGGNILVGDDYALVGRNLLARNRNLHHPGLDMSAAEKKITAEFCRVLGMRDVYFLGEDTEISFAKTAYPEHPEALQPFFHLDLYVTLAGHNKAGDEIVLLAEIDLPSVSKDLTPSQRSILNQLNSSLKAVKDQLVKISEECFGPKFAIEEIPMSGVFRTNTKGEDIFVPYSYNNAQVEWWHGISRIYLPHYPGKEALENRLRENLPGLGFGRLTFVEHDFEDYAKQNGSLHCLTKVLRRTHHTLT